MAMNSVQPGGVHPLPNVFTGSNGPVTGEETQITVNLTTRFDLPADHYFFVPQVKFRPRRQSQRLAHRMLRLSSVAW
jgi:hypothetical protein